VSEEGPGDEPEEAGPGLGGGDVLVALAVSAGGCGAVLTVLMAGQPSQAYVRLRQLTAPWTIAPHRLVASILAPALLGLFLMALAARTRSPPLPLPSLARGDVRGLPMLLLSAAGLFVFLTGLVSWLAVMLLS
jgi:hypothetical protein